jgi:hypothetical protein
MIWDDLLIGVVKFVINFLFTELAKFVTDFVLGLF